MSIQWFPGHMHLTRKAITERVKDIDVVIEMLDARLPGSSANPLLAELTAGRPTLKDFIPVADVYPASPAAVDARAIIRQIESARGRGRGF